MSYCYSSVVNVLGPFELIFYSCIDQRVCRGVELSKIFFVQGFLSFSVLINFSITRTKSAITFSLTFPLFF